MNRALIVSLLALLACSSESPARKPAPSSTSATGGEGGAHAGGSGGGGEGGAGGAGGAVGVETPVVLLPRTSILASELAMIVNDQDPQSVAVAAYYRTARGIPDENVITVSFAVKNVMPEAEFAPIRQQVEAALDETIQALVLTWTQPHRVSCMSTTSAFALGFDKKYCNTTGKGCGPTFPSTYFDSDSSRPFTDHAVRPTMSLAGSSTNDAIALIDRGVAADGTFPSGDGWFIRTTDKARSVRWPEFVNTLKDWDYEGSLKLTYVDNSGGNGSNTIQDEKDVMFYFTGLTTVPGIDTLTYRPGAIADHLTSFGGQIPSGSQMSVVEWLKAGATASFGTTVEPCNYTQKFPNTKLLLPHYFRGETLIEAYWKSVWWPGEGLFVGEPLAKPWGTQLAGVSDGKLVIRTTILNPDKIYQLGAADNEEGPYEIVLEGVVMLHHKMVEVTVNPPFAAFYKLAETGQL